MKQTIKLSELKEVIKEFRSTKNDEDYDDFDKGYDGALDAIEERFFGDVTTDFEEVVKKAFCKKCGSELKFIRNVMAHVENAKEGKEECFIEYTPEKQIEWREVRK